MFSDPETLYKLMVLYLLKKVNFPVTNSQMSEFMVSKEYTNFFTFQKVLSELLDANLIRLQTMHNSSHYEITPEGEQTLGFFENKLSPAIIADIDEFLKTNKFKMRDEVAVRTETAKLSDTEFLARMSVMEGKTPLFELSLSLPSQEQAEKACNRFREKNQFLYERIVKELLE